VTMVTLGCFGIEVEPLCLLVAGPSGIADRGSASFAFQVQALHPGSAEVPRTYVGSASSAFR